ncbi:hypothetical protein HKX48_000923, partial [Thoreauomyces humboldtii]
MLTAAAVHGSQPPDNATPPSQQQHRQQQQHPPPPEDIPSASSLPASLNPKRRTFGQVGSDTFVETLSRARGSSSPPSAPTTTVLPPRQTVMDVVVSAPEAELLAGSKVDVPVPSFEVRADVSTDRHVQRSSLEATPPVDMHLGRTLSRTGEPHGIREEPTSPSEWTSHVTPSPPAREGREPRILTLPSISDALLKRPSRRGRSGGSPSGAGWIAPARLIPATDAPDPILAPPSVAADPIRSTSVRYPNVSSEELIIVTAPPPPQDRPFTAPPPLHPMSLPPTPPRNALDNSPPASNPRKALSSSQTRSPILPDPIPRKPKSSYLTSSFHACLSWLPLFAASRVEKSNRRSISSFSNVNDKNVKRSAGFCSVGRRRIPNGKIKTSKKKSDAETNNHHRKGRDASMSMSVDGPLPPPPSFLKYDLGLGSNQSIQTLVRGDGVAVPTTMHPDVAVAELMSKAKRIDGVAAPIGTRRGTTGSRRRRRRGFVSTRTEESEFESSDDAYDVRDDRDDDEEEEDLDGTEDGGSGIAIGPLRTRTGLEMPFHAGSEITLRLPQSDDQGGVPWTALKPRPSFDSGRSTGTTTGGDVLVRGPTTHVAPSGQGKHKEREEEEEEGDEDHETSPLRWVVTDHGTTEENAAGPTSEEGQSSGGTLGRSHRNSNIPAPITLVDLSSPSQTTSDTTIAPPPPSPPLTTTTTTAIPTPPLNLLDDLYKDVLHS